MCIFLLRYHYNLFLSTVCTSNIYTQHKAYRSLNKNLSIVFNVTLSKTLLLHVLVAFKRIPKLKIMRYDILHHVYLRKDCYKKILHRKISTICLYTSKLMPLAISKKKNKERIFVYSKMIVLIIYFLKK